MKIPGRGVGGTPNDTVAHEPPLSDSPQTPERQSTNKKYKFPGTEAEKEAAKKLDLSTITWSYGPTSPHFDKLRALCTAKRDVQRLAVDLLIFEKAAKKKIDSFSLVRENALLKTKADPAFETAFNEKGKSLLLRTLTTNDSAQRDFPSRYFDQSGRTLAHREACILSGNSAGKFTAIVPATLINKKVMVNTIAQAGLGRERWAGLPSIVSQPLTSDDAEVQKLHDRPGFGDIHSFSSTEAFTPRYNKHSPLLSHSEKLSFLKEESAHLMKHDPLREDRNFADSINRLEQKLIVHQEKTPGVSLRHNEYCARLELWDARAIEVGQYRDVATATMIEFNLEMRALHRQLKKEGEGVESERFVSHMERQLSWPGSADAEVLNVQAVALALNVFSGEKSKKRWAMCYSV